MSVKRKFNFPMSALVKEGKLILTAAESHLEEMTRRLGNSTVSNTRTVLASLSEQTSEQAQKTSDAGEFTEE